MPQVLPINAQKVVEYFDRIIQTNTDYVLSGSYVDIVQYKAACMTNRELRRVRNEVIEQFAKDEEE